MTTNTLRDQIAALIDGRTIIDADELRAILDAQPPQAEPVAWRCKDYADGWILYSSLAQAACYQRRTGCAMQPLYAHPAAGGQP